MLTAQCVIEKSTLIGPMTRQHVIRVISFSDLQISPSLRNGFREFTGVPLKSAVFSGYFTSEN